MTTLAILTLDCRSLIGEPVASHFTDDVLYDYINYALADLSKYFPVTKEYALSTTLNVRTYDLENDFLDVLSVEFPTSNVPPTYLLRRSYTHPEFWSTNGYYDIVQSFDDTTTNPPQILISEKPAASKTITVKYHGTHNVLTASSDVCTLQTHLLHLVALFVRWKCWQEMATKEGIDPDQTKLLAATIEVNAGRAEKAYRTALTEARKGAAESAQVHWHMDDNDRIY